MNTEKQIVEYVSEKIGRTCKTEYVLRDLSGIELGYVDYVWEIENNILVFLEYENQQHHPCTNVLKVWPYLESHTEYRILLIQLFENKKVSSRTKLAFFVGAKMEECLSVNFEYIPYLLSDWVIEALKRKVLSTIKRFISPNIV